MNLVKKLQLEHHYPFSFSNNMDSTQELLTDIVAELKEEASKIKRTHCLSCNATTDKLELILDLGFQPWCNDFRKEKHRGYEKLYPLRWVFCHNCKLFQLDTVPEKEIMFSEHTYVSGTSNTLREHFYNTSKEIVDMYDMKNDDLIVEFGSNDGTCLQQFQKLGYTNVVGIESAHNIAKIANDNGVYTINEYFNEACVDKNFGDKKAKIIHCAGVFFHLEEIHSVLRGVKKLLDKQGVFVIQCMYLIDVVKNTTFDVLYHEHTSIYDIVSLGNLLKQYGLHIKWVKHYDIHGGSLVAHVTHEPEFETDGSVKYRFEAVKDRGLFNSSNEIIRLGNDEVRYGTIQAIRRFANTVHKRKNILRDVIDDLKEQYYKKIEYENIKKPIFYCIGAPAKGTVALNYWGVDNKIVEACIEKNKLKVGLHVPAMHIPIIDEEEFLNGLKDKEDLSEYYFILLAWNFIDEIKRNWQWVLDKGAKLINPPGQILDKDGNWIFNPKSFTPCI